MLALKKITSRDVVGNVYVGIIPKDKNEVDLYTVAGLVRSYKPGESNFGPFIRFTGDFGAVNLFNGDDSRSSTLIMPPVVSDLLQHGLAQAKGQTIKFAFTVGIKRVPADAKNFEYTVKVLEKPSTTDAFGELAAKYLKAPPKVAAPVAAKK